MVLQACVLGKNATFLMKSVMLGRSAKEIGEVGLGQPTAGSSPAAEQDKVYQQRIHQSTLNLTEVTREGHINTINLAKVSFNIAGSMWILQFYY